MKTALLLLLACALSGCAPANVYEGLKTRETARNPTPDPVPASQLPPYDQYDAERKKLLDSRPNP